MRTACAYEKFVTYLSFFISIQYSEEHWLFNSLIPDIATLEETEYGMDR